jgi:hypothetical protein
MNPLKEEKLENVWDSEHQNSSKINAATLEEQGTIDPKQQKRFLSPEQTYTLGFRLVSLLFLGIFLFIAALYYGVINP